MSIHFNKVKDTITGSYGKNVQFAVPYSDEVFKKIKQLSEDADKATTVAELETLFKAMEEVTKQDLAVYIESKVPNVHKHTNGKYYLKTGNVISSVAMPEALVKRLEDTIDNDLDATPLIKFWTRFLRNPKLRKLDKKGQEAFSNKVFNYVNLPFVNEEILNELVNDKGYTREVALEMATVPQVKITKEGLISSPLV